MDKIGKYEVLRKIGAGGFAAVYEGRDPYLKRRVAIKTCATDSEDIRQRFYREAEIAGNLEHRNIVTVFDFGFEDTVPYLVQEYLPGEDLDHRMGRREPFPAPRKLEILEQVAEGLAYAHGQGVIHRDIKPGNIRLLEDGRVKIMDFGIARLQSVETRLTKAGMTVGTAAYLSPEQVRGEPGGPQADVWAWGVLAYELLSGARPFEGVGMAELLNQVLDQSPRPLAEVWKECPPRLAELVARCLDKDPSRRYPGFPEVITDLAPLVRVATAAKPAAPGKEAAVNAPDGSDGMDKTVRMTAEQLQKLASEGGPAAEALSPVDPSAVTAETAARPLPVEPTPAPGSDNATRVLASVDPPAPPASPAAPAAPSPTPAPTPMPSPAVPGPAAAPDPGRTSVLATPPPPPRPAPTPPAPKPAAAPPPPLPPTPPKAPPSAPAAKPVSAARPAAAPAAKKKSAMPWLLVGLGLVVMLLAAAALFWFVVRPRLKARFANALEVPIAEAPATDSSSATAEGSPAEPAPSQPAPATDPGSLSIGAPARPGTTVSIDGGPPIPLARAVTLQMAPGDHELAFAAPGRAPSTVHVAVEAGAAQSLDVPELSGETPASTAAPRKPRKRVEVAPPPPPPAPEPAPAVVEPPPPPPVHRGDLVEFGPGVVRPKLLRSLSADYPPAAKRQRAEARIGVAVLVDENGKVVDARIAEGDGRGLGFEEVSLRAARAGAFQPATKNGVAVKMWHTVYLTFRSK